MEIKTPTKEEKKGNYVISIQGETTPRMVFLDETPEYITDVIKFMTSSPTFMAVPTRFIASKSPARVIVDNPLHGIVVDVKSVSKEEAQKVISSLIKTVSGKNSISFKNLGQAKSVAPVNKPEFRSKTQQLLHNTITQRLNQISQQKQQVNVQTQKPQTNQQNHMQGIQILKKPNQSKVVVLNIRNYKDQKSLQQNNRQQSNKPQQKPQQQSNKNQNNQQKQPLLRTQQLLHNTINQTLNQLFNKSNPFSQGNKPQQLSNQQNNQNKPNQPHQNIKIQKIVWQQKPQQKPQQQSNKNNLKKSVSIRDEIRNIIKQELSNLNKKK